MWQQWAPVSFCQSHRNLANKKAIAHERTFSTSIFATGRSFWLDGTLHLLCYAATHFDIHLTLTHLSVQSLQHHTSAKCMEGEKWQCNILRQTWFWSRTHPRLSSLHLVVNLQASTCCRINSGRGVTVQVFLSQDFEVTKIPDDFLRNSAKTNIHHHIQIWTTKSQNLFQTQQLLETRNSACWRKTMASNWVSDPACKLPPPDFGDRCQGSQPDWFWTSWHLDKPSERKPGWRETLRSWPSCHTSGTLQSCCYWKSSAGNSSTTTPRNVSNGDREKKKTTPSFLKSRFFRFFPGHPTACHPWIQDTEWNMERWKGGNSATPIIIHHSFLYGQPYRNNHLA